MGNAVHPGENANKKKEIKDWKRKQVKGKRIKHILDLLISSNVHTAEPNWSKALKFTISNLKKQKKGNYFFVMFNQIREGLFLAVNGHHHHFMANYSTGNVPS